MRKFLNRFMERPIVNICCLAACSLLLVATHAEATPQKTPNKIELHSFLNKSSNATSTKWAVPSSSCFSRSACVADPNFQQEFKNFVSFIQTKYPSAQVPSAAQLQQKACNTLSPPGSTTTPDNLDAITSQWLASFLSYSFWVTEAGTNPYQTSPVWWCFLDNSSRYVVTDTREVDGGTNIIADYEGLGKSQASGGQGFYVNQVVVTDIYPVASLEPGVLAAQTYVQKELVVIDLAGATAGTTKPLDQYTAIMKLQSHDTYPRKTISLINETINTLKTIEWVSLCTIACKNCAPGTVCS